MQLIQCTLKTSNVTVLQALQAQFRINNLLRCPRIIGLIASDVSVLSALNTQNVACENKVTMFKEYSYNTDTSFSRATISRIYESILTLYVHRISCLNTVFLEANDLDNEKWKKVSPYETEVWLMLKPE